MLSCFFSIGQFGFGSRSILRAQPVYALASSKSFFRSFLFFSIFESGGITKHLRVNVTKNQRNRGHSSKFNFAHTLSIGRPKSHTYDKDVRLLKFSLVWEKST